MRQLIHAAILIVILSITGCVSPLSDGLVAQRAYETLYDSVTIEVQAVQGVEPTRNTFKILSELFEQYKICKKEDVLIVYKYPVNFPVIAWNNSMVHSFEELFRAVLDENRTDRDYTVFVSYLPGVYTKPDLHNVAGLQYNWSSIAVFGRYSERKGATLLLHEFGHLIGVARNNRGVKPVNPQRPRHCNSRGCVMFWQWNHTNGFCDICINDILKILAKKNKNIQGSF